ncbi:MAG: hypothetical protein AB7J13_14210 [Pyrinomonadaceae bacterium]
MQIFKAKARALAAGLVAVLIGTGCQSPLFQSAEPTVVTMASVPAVRLNYRYEADVPAPVLDPSQQTDQDRNAAVQADFDTNRTQELLDKTITSPDKKRVAAVYHRVTDYSSEYRLDMYSADGTLLKKLTSDAMAVHFPDTIVWSPDSSSLAFVAMIRVNAPDLGIPTLSEQGANVTAPSPAPDEDSIIDATNSELDSTPTPDTAGAPTPPTPTGILTFRTEQIYICDSEGVGVKPITLNEGLIYFYFAWSPDSTMLVAQAATSREWRFIEVMANSKDEMMVPQGRLRIIEKNGRERRLDDNLSAVRPVWSPDSTKVAAAYDTQIRIYDAMGTNPTQAAIPLRNQLLISSQAYDRNQQKQTEPLEPANTDPNAAAPTPDAPNEPLSTLPDEKLLVSYNPIVEIAWTADDLLYLQTAYLRRMKIETESVRSFSRWHRLVLSSQPETPVR